LIFNILKNIYVNLEFGENWNIKIVALGHMPYIKQLLSITALLLLVTISNAQRVSLNQGGATPGYYEELPYEDINGKLFVTVEVGGIKRHFMFDTGAPCMLSEALANELKSPEIYKDTVRDVNNVATITALVKTDITLGKTLFASVPALKGWPATGLLSCWPIDGIIGSNILRNSIVRIDSKRHLIIITDQKNKLDLKSTNSAKMDAGGKYESSPLLHMLVMGVNSKVDLSLEFDSGDNALLRLTENETSQMEQFHVLEVLAKGYGATTYGMLGLQQAADKYRVRFPRIVIGKTPFENMATETNKTGIPGVGTALLKYGILTLDFIHGKYYFDADSAVNNLAGKQWPFSPGINDNKLIVGIVWNKATAKVLPGEQIMAINDIDYSHIDLCDMLNKVPALASKQSAIFTIKDKDGNLRKVEINKE
jgi:hypothetical protein